MEDQTGGPHRALSEQVPEASGLVRKARAVPVEEATSSTVQQGHEEVGP